MPADDAALIDLAEREAAPWAGRAHALAGPQAERQLEQLGRLAEVGLQIAEALARQARGEGEAPADPADLALAYSRVSRAVRLTLALQSKLVSDLEALDRAVARRVSWDQGMRSVDRKRRVAGIVARVIDADPQRDDEEADALVEEAYERLDRDDIYGQVLLRPVSELVAEICRDLGLSPDWPSLAEEAWAREEVAAGAPGAPLAALHNAPLSLDGGEAGSGGGCGPPEGSARAPPSQPFTHREGRAP